jgi:DNA-directed RNA polymerase specialized sigma24 family protein
MIDRLQSESVMDAHPVAPSCTPEEFSRLLDRLREGDRRAESELFPVVHDELRKLGAAKMRAPEFFRVQGRPTSIVHEAYLRLGADRIRAQDRAQFFGLMARVMHNLLVDRVRENAALKRSGQWARVEMPDVPATAPGPAFELEGLNQAPEESAKSMQTCSSSSKCTISARPRLRKSLPRRERRSAP